MADKNYKSDAMNFIKTIVANNQQIKQNQEKLRNTWWDINHKDVDCDRELSQNNLKANEYMYY